MYNVNMNATLDLPKALTQLRRLLPLLHEKYHVRTLEVFGSFVRGEAGSGSDLDLLVTFDRAPTLLQFVALENMLNDELGVKVDLVMKDSLKPELGKYILAEAKTV